MSAHELPAPPPPAGPRPQRPAERLNLVGVSQDGKRLRLTSATGTEFTVDVDGRLRAALSDQRAETARSGPPKDGNVEIQMSSLRPRDIQARIRAGETAESVAAAAQTTVEKVMPYAAPVLAEREHVAERALRSSIRRPAGSDGAGHARTLGDAVEGQLRALNVDPGGVAWDAWRREDGRWALVARFSVPGREGLGELTFDQPGNFVVLDNDDARWLVGDVEDVEDALDPAPVEPQAPVRRLSAVPEEQLAFGDDVLELVNDDRAESTLDLTETVASIRDGLPTEQPLEAFLDDQPGLDEHALREEAADAAALDQERDHRGEPVTPRRPAKKSRGRASVPSWDEIMFGGKD